MKNLDFYIVHVVSSEKNRPETNQLLNKEHLDNLLLQGLASGESIEVTEQWWDEKRAALKKT
jgi:antitoxin ParD1/3/4